jgi:CheY-like chemotaxis protein
VARVLVVDDDEVIREFIAVHLRGAGFEVALAADGSTALDKIRQLRPAVVTVDAAMPGLTGSDLASIIHSDPATAAIRIVLLWPARADHDHVGDRSAGIDACLAKPVNPDDLVRIVRLLAAPTGPGSR